MPLIEPPPDRGDRIGGYLVVGSWLMALVVVLWRVAHDLSIIGAIILSAIY